MYVVFYSASSSMTSSAGSLVFFALVAVLTFLEAGLVVDLEVRARYYDRLIDSLIL